MKKTSGVTLLYNEIEVSYNEDLNRWEFELRGRSRSADSLKAAKEAIDAPPPKEKKPFKRVQAFKFGWDGITTGEVTSIADNTGYSSPPVWFTAAGSREKINSTKLYLVNDENNKKLETWKATKKTKDGLEKEMEKIVKAMATVESLIGKDTE